MMVQICFVHKQPMGQSETFFGVFQNLFLLSKLLTHWFGSISYQQLRGWSETCTCVQILFHFSKPLQKLVWVCSTHTQLRLSRDLCGFIPKIMGSFFCLSSPPAPTTHTLQVSLFLVSLARKVQIVLEFRLAMMLRMWGPPLLQSHTRGEENWETHPYFLTLLPNPRDFTYF